jgi:ribonucleoside-diphosphate reductase alpha chain
VYQRRESGERLLPDGKDGHRLYQCRENHELIVSRTNVPLFAEKIGFLTEAKQAKLAREMPSEHEGFYSEPYTATFTTLEADGEEMVYDLTEPVHHAFIANGLYVSNCGEQPLQAGAVCNLGALNLARYVDDNGQLLETDLARDAAHAARFLDDVIEATPYFSELHVKMQREGTRRIGLGTMGLADALIKMRVPYGSAESLDVIDTIYRIIRDATYQESVALAEEKGPCGFFEAEKYLQGPFIKRLPEPIRAGIKEHGIRNGVLLTQAPTGTTSLLAGVSSGIEPVYTFVMKRVDRIGEHIIYHPLYEAWQAAHPGEENPDYFISAQDLAPEEHVAIQARVQQYTDSSISKTVNGPADQTVEDVKRLYILAYDLGCKGVTYYRDGSRDAVLSAVTEAPRVVSADAPVMTTSQEASPMPTPTTPIVAPTEAAPMPTRDVRYRHGMKVRADVVQGYTRQVRAPEGKVNVTLNSDDDGLFEIFVNVGKAGSDVAALAEALGRMISIHLQIDSPVSQSTRAAEVAHQLRSIGGSGSIGFGVDRVRSLPDAVARALELHQASMRPVTAVDDATNAPSPTASAPGDTGHAGGGMSNGHTSTTGGRATGVNPGNLALYTVTGNLCPSCGCNTLVYEEGCKKCHNCGHSEC